MNLNAIKDPITGEYPVLVALQGPLEGRRFLIKTSLEIGRESECDVSIEDRQVSRHHARVLHRKGICFLEDLGSKNGTFHTGSQFDGTIELHDGDVFQIALVQKFAFYSSDATMPMSDLDPSVSAHKGTLVLDEKSRRVWVKDRELIPSLSAAQFRLLYMLYLHAGNVVNRMDLIQAIWEDEEAAGVSEQALDALIRRLRSRLAELDDKHRYIITIRGHGVRFDNK